jgi:hypothetical protein
MHTVIFLDFVSFLCSYSMTSRVFVIKIEKDPKYQFFNLVTLHLLCHKVVPISECGP